MKKLIAPVCFILVLVLLSVAASAAQSFDITIKQSDGGIVVCEKFKAEAGEKVSFTVTSDAGCRLFDAAASDAAGGKVTVTGEKESGTLSFEMPSSDVEIKVWFAPEHGAAFTIDGEKPPAETGTAAGDETTPPATAGTPSAAEPPASGNAIPSTPTDVPEEPFKNPFTDVKEKDYFYDAVMWAYKNGITKGMTETAFVPNRQCSRAQLVTFLWRAEGCPEPKTAKNPFKDVSEKDDFYKPVLWAVEKGITTGVTADTFRPYDVCKRGQVVTFLYRAKSGSINALSTAFSDVDMSLYYGDPVAWAIEQKITRGITATLFGPEDDCTRGQVVTFIYRAYAK